MKKIIRFRCSRGYLITSLKNPYFPLFKLKFPAFLTLFSSMVATICILFITVTFGDFNFWHVFLALTKIYVLRTDEKY